MYNNEFDDTMHVDTATTIVSEQAQLGNIGTPLIGVALHYGGGFSVPSGLAAAGAAESRVQCALQCQGALYIMVCG